MSSERKGLKLFVWIALTVFVAVVLIGGDGSTVSVVCGVSVVVVGVLTIALILSGCDPWWTRTRQARRAASRHRRLD
jgi:ribose/xylose/arabinose/galactoside ABC-type transport system permease subunit